MSPASIRSRSPKHLAWVRTQPCLVCMGPAEAHHLMFPEPSAMGSKSGDRWAVPLCRTHHRDLHLAGAEATWWAMQGVDPLDWIVRNPGPE